MSGKRRSKKKKKSKLTIDRIQLLVDLSHTSASL